jgi:hypothetical protein
MQERILISLDAFWQDLTPEKAFLARVYGEHLRSIKVSASRYQGEREI